MCLNYSEGTIARWIVSNEGQHGGVEKETPQQPAHLVTGGRGTGQGWLPVQEVIYHDQDGCHNKKARLMPRSFFNKNNLSTQILWSVLKGETCELKYVMHTLAFAELPA